MSAIHDPRSSEPARAGDRGDEPLHEGARKAERLARARRRPSDAWSALARVAGLGWVLALPLALGALGGRLVARWLDRPTLALVGLGLGLAAGAYGVYRQVKLGLTPDDDEIDENNKIMEREEIVIIERRDPNQEPSDGSDA